MDNPKHSSRLPDRGVVRVTGADASSFLQGLVTNDVASIAVDTAHYAALLTPQGKILFDFLLVGGPEDFFLDCPLSLAPDLAKRLGFYRLRAKVTVADRSAEHCVVAAWDEDAPAWVPEGSVARFADPRHPKLGQRFICTRSAVTEAIPAEGYDAHRIALGIPQGGPDFAYGDTFPHEANLDRLHGLDFKKGCYVGQEVVSRMQHRGTARKRIAAVRLDGPTPVPGAEVFAGDVSIGIMGSSVGATGLALLRLDRAADAAGLGTALMAGETTLTLIESEP